MFCSIGTALTRVTWSINDVQTSPGQRVKLSMEEQEMSCTQRGRSPITCFLCRARSECPSGFGATVASKYVRLKV
jgi:hypothetical protein